MYLRVSRHFLVGRVGANPSERAHRAAFAIATMDMAGPPGRDLSRTGSATISLTQRPGPTAPGADGNHPSDSTQPVG